MSEIQELTRAVKELMKVIMVTHYGPLFMVKTGEVHWPEWALEIAKREGWV